MAMQHEGACGFLIGRCRGLRRDSSPYLCLCTCMCVLYLLLSRELVFATRMGVAVTRGQVSGQAACRALLGMSCGVGWYS